jgi:flagellar motor switch protein FliG
MTDEKVDGAKIAASILNHMPDDSRKRLLKAIGDSDPALFSKIETHIVCFEDILEISDESTQLLIKEVSHDDLVISLKKVNEKIKIIMLSNMSERKVQMVKDDLDLIKDISDAEVINAQRKIAIKLDELREKGLIRSRIRNEAWA